MASIFPNRFCSNILTHPSHFNFGFRVQQTANPEKPVRKIIKYKTVKGSQYIINLDKEVNALIQQGYQPWGSPYVFQDIELFACQAMVLYEDTPKTTTGPEES
jgi:hypothetical protein